MFLLKGVLGTVLLFVLFIAIVVAILFHESIRNLKIFRSSNEKAADRAARKAAKEEEYFRRTSTKNYRADDKPNFSKDYFKGEQSAGETNQTGRTGQQKEQPKETPRSTTGCPFWLHSWVPMTCSCPCRLTGVWAAAFSARANNNNDNNFFIRTPNLLYYNNVKVKT